MVQPFLIQGIASFVPAFVVAVILSPVMIAFAKRYNLMDKPGSRKVHKNPIPRLGGVAIFFGTWAAWLSYAFFFTDYIPYEAYRPMWGIFGASLLVWILGVYDDLKGTNAYQKLAVQLFAAAWAVSQGVGVKLLTNPFDVGDFILSPVWSWALSIAWIVIVTNSINLIDGLDGLAAGVCCITALTIFFISKDLGHRPHLPYMSLCIAGACLGFLIFNFSPARIFLGDSGSLFLGFMLACLSTQGTSKRSAAIIMFGPPLILALPMADTCLAILRRLFASPSPLTLDQIHPRSLMQRFKQVFNADQEHIHHALLTIGLSHRRAAIILYIVTTILGITAYKMSVENHLYSTLIVFAVLSLCLLWLRKRSSKIKKRKAK